MDEKEITDDLFELVKEALVVNGRWGIQRVEGSSNQLRLMYDDGSSAVITVRGKR